MRAVPGVTAADAGRAAGPGRTPCEGDSGNRGPALLLGPAPLGHKASRPASPADPSVAPRLGPDSRAGGRAVPGRLGTPRARGMSLGQSAQASFVTDLPVGASGVSPGWRLAP